MEKKDDTLTVAARLARGLRRAIKLLGSLRLAVVLLATLGAVIGTATVLEADHGRLYAQWYVYHSGWFMALLGLLGVNIFCAAASRWPFKRHQVGFVVTHGGLLVLLTGSIVSFVKGVEGQVTLAEKETTTTMSVAQQSRITAFWVNRPAEAPYEFTFQPGPVDWPEGTWLDVGEVDGVGVRIRHYFAHGEATEQWAADESGTGGPLVRFTLEGAGNQRVAQALVDQGGGDEMFVGPLRVQLQRAGGPAALEQFLRPQPTGNTSSGVELLEMPDGRLYCRLVSDAGIVPQGEIELGRAIQLPSNFKFAVVEHLPHVRQRVVFDAVTPETDQKQKPEAAAEVEVRVAGVKQSVWLQRDHPTFSTGTVTTPEGTLRLVFGHAEAPLGFSLTLLEFHRDVNPGGIGNAAFSSVVRLVDPERGVDEKRTISMNEPLTYNGLTFYQAGFDDGNGAKASTFSVARDPGRLAKYAGSLMICVGIAIMFYMRAYFFRTVPGLLRGQRGEPAMSASPAETSQGEAAVHAGPGSEELLLTADSREN